MNSRDSDKHKLFTGVLLPDKTLTKVGNMVWPSYGEAVSDLALKLRYAPRTLTREDELTAASVISAYILMIETQQKKRNAVCKALREAYRMEKQYE